MPRLRRTETTENQNATENNLLEENQYLKAALLRAQNVQGELHEMIEKISAAPWYPALFQRVVETPQGVRAMVWTGGNPRLVNLHPTVNVAGLASGNHVYLDHDLATLMAPSEGAFVPPTDSASFDRIASDGRIVVRSRGEDIVLEPSACLDADALRSGQTVLFDRPSRMALESMEGVEGDRYQLEDVGDLSRDCVGGRRETLDDLISVLTASLVEPELARTYQIGGRRAVLLHGPPGCGKTLMAKTAAAEIQRISGKRCHFAVVRPGEFESAYVGESEANIRNCFRSLREAAGDDLAVLFLDEIESIGRSRGSQGARHADRFLAALLAEIDGFCERGQVSILAATNRRDLLDPALLSRLSDTQIAVPRPNQQAAREIFEIHLPMSLPYARGHGETAIEPDSQEAAEVRSELLETTVSRLYAPNADNEICRLDLRDGTSRTVCARELMSGRLIEQLALSVREKAFRRHILGEGQGLRVADAVASVETSLAELSTTLSVHNTRAYLDDLPQDIDVVRVDPIRPQPERRYRYYHAA
jgi:ATP-dependent 26S proteasome regulatory subunit